LEDKKIEMELSLGTRGAFLEGMNPSIPPKEALTMKDQLLPIFGAILVLLCALMGMSA
jgi:hypothetical protein